MAYLLVLGGGTQLKTNRVFVVALSSALWSDFARVDDMDQIGSYEECDTFLELYALAQKGDRRQVEQLITDDGVDVDIRFTVRCAPTHKHTARRWAAT